MSSAPADGNGLTAVAQPSQAKRHLVRKLAPVSEEFRIPSAAILAATEREAEKLSGEDEKTKTGAARAKIVISTTTISLQDSSSTRLRCDAVSPASISPCLVKARRNISPAEVDPRSWRAVF